MMPTLLLAVPLLSITCVLTIGCVGSCLLRERPDAATRVQRTCLIATFAAFLLFALIAVLPASRRPSLKLLRPPAPMTAPTITVAPSLPSPMDREAITPAVAPASSPVPLVRSNVQSAAPPKTPADPLVILIALWLVGSAAPLLYLLHGHLSLIGLRSRSKPLADALYRAEVERAAHAASVTCPAVRMHTGSAGPLLTGVLPPTLYLPASLPVDPLLRQMLFAHEIAHLSRADVPYLLLSRLLCAALWWHPLAHLLTRQMQQTAEVACDAVALTGRCAPHAPAYAQFLLSLADSWPNGSRSVSAVTMAIRTPRSQVGRRIEYLLTAHSNKPISPLLRGAVTACTTLLLLAGGIVQSSLSAPVPPSPSAASANVPTAGDFETAFFASSNKAGPLDAELQVIEFSDFECPSCRRANKPRPYASTPWRTAWRGIRLQFRHLPLEQHPSAYPAAVMAQRFAQKGKFWFAHDNLFAGRSVKERLALLKNDQVIFTERPSDAAAQAAYDAQTEQVSQKARAQVARDRELARTWDVTNTPTYFVFDRRDNKVHRFIGYAALNQFLLGARPTSLRVPKQEPVLRISIDCRNNSLHNALKMTFQLAEKNYEIDPRLNLENAYITLKFTDQPFPLALDLIRQASAVPFEIKLADDGKTYLIMPPSAPATTP